MALGPQPWPLLMKTDSVILTIGSVLTFKKRFGGNFILVSYDLSFRCGCVHSWV